MLCLRCHFFTASLHHTSPRSFKLYSPRPRSASPSTTSHTNYNSTKRYPTRKPRISHSSTQRQKPTKQNTLAIHPAGQIPINTRTLPEHYAETIKNMDRQQFTALRTSLKTALKTMNVHKPTTIQSMALQTLLSTKNPKEILIAAETGSGKTLAYLLPIIQKLKIQEETDSEFKRRVMAPRAVILVPTRELVAQVLATCKELSHEAKFRAVGVTIRMRDTEVRKAFATPCDVLITTPERLYLLNQHNLCSLAHIEYLVIDEADTLFADKFDHDVISIIKNVRATAERYSRSTNFIIVTATVPRLVNEMLDQQFPKIEKVVSPGLHLPPANLDFRWQTLVKPTGDTKPKLLADIIRTSSTYPILVFCNTQASASNLHNMLTQTKLSAPLHDTMKLADQVCGYKKWPLESEATKYIHARPKHNYTVQEDGEKIYDKSWETQHYAEDWTSRIGKLHGDMPSDERTLMLERLRNTEEAKITPDIVSTITPRNPYSMIYNQKEGYPPKASFPAGTTNERKLIEDENAHVPIHVLIATDIASRGMDFTRIAHVINYDMPYSSVDFLHRAGRCARDGRPGLVTSIFGRQDRTLVSGLQSAIKNRRGVDWATTSRV